MRLEEGLANVSELAKLLGFDRRTIKSRIDESALKPIDKVGKSNLYRVSEVAQAIYGGIKNSSSLDPEEMSPSERRDYWHARQKELDYCVAIKKYISAEDVRKDYAQLIDSISEKIQSYPDVCERDFSATTDEVERLLFLCDQLQLILHEAVSE